MPTIGFQLFKPRACHIGITRLGKTLPLFDAAVLCPRDRPNSEFGKARQAGETNEQLAERILANPNEYGLTGIQRNDSIDENLKWVTGFPASASPPTRVVFHLPSLGS